jgi:adenosylmethionine-8-amino-7-oxononanoate aminotransferase
MEIVKDRQTKEYFPAEAGLAARLTQGFADNGVLLRGGDAMNVAPPLCVTAGEIDEIVSAMDRVIAKTAHDLGAE